MIKCTALFQLATNFTGGSAGGPRIAGWSESWYINNTPAFARTSFGVLCLIRAGLLPNGAAIVGQRYQVIGGGSSTASRRFPAGSGMAADAPQIGILCKFPGSAVANIRRLTLRGIPDGIQIEGERVDNFLFEANFAQYVRCIADNGFLFRGRDLAAPTARIASISSRVMTLADPLVFAVGDFMILRDVRTTTGRSVSGRYQVEATTGGTNATLRGFPSTSTVDNNGFASKHTIIYPSIDRTQSTMVKTVVKKVGRPFDQYRGRASKRNRV